MPRGCSGGGRNLDGGDGGGDGGDGCDGGGNGGGPLRACIG